MNKPEQIKKAERFLALHHDPKLLVMPNIWDPLGGRMLQELDFPAVATASAAVAFSLGYDDGQKITLQAMLDSIKRIADHVDVLHTNLVLHIQFGYVGQANGRSQRTFQIV